MKNNPKVDLKTISIGLSLFWHLTSNLAVNTEAVEVNIWYEHRPQKVQHFTVFIKRTLNIHLKVVFHRNFQMANPFTLGSVTKNCPKSNISQLEIYGPLGPRQIRGQVSACRAWFHDSFNFVFFRIFSPSRKVFSHCLCSSDLFASTLILLLHTGDGWLEVWWQHFI